MLISIGTVTVPLARIIDAKMAPAPKNKIAQSTINKSCCPNTTTVGSVMNKAIKYFEKRQSSAIKAPVNKKSEEKRTIGDGQALKNKMQETLKKMKAANKKK